MLKSKLQKLNGLKHENLKENIIKQLYRMNIIRTFWKMLIIGKKYMIQSKILKNNVIYKLLVWKKNIYPFMNMKKM